MIDQPPGRGKSAPATTALALLKRTVEIADPPRHIGVAGGPMSLPIRVQVSDA